MLMRRDSEKAIAWMYIILKIKPCLKGLHRCRRLGAELAMADGLPATR
jgi:hypothetical protein